jgi:Glycosyltransferase 61
VRPVPAGVRQVAHSALRRMASAGSAIGWRPPIEASVLEWANRQGLPSTIVLPPCETVRRLPRTIEPEIDDVFIRRRTVSQPGKYLVSLHGAKVLGPHGLVVLPDGSYAAESVFNDAHVKIDPSYYLPRRRVVSKQGDYFSLLVKFAMADRNNYYHWMHDTLERLYGVQSLLPADTNFIVPADLGQVHRESLRLLGVSDDQLVFFSGADAWQLETLHFSPQTTDSGVSRREVDEWLRDRTLAAFNVSLGAPSRRNFISRRDTSKRRLVNESEVESYLHQHGFETCLPETLTLGEQVKLFSQAEVVVSTHGSAFTNILFAPPGLTVVDMIQPSMIRWGSVFWAMAEELGHRYWYLAADSVPRPGHQDDTYVPVDRLAATLSEIGLDGSLQTAH